MKYKTLEKYHVYGIGEQSECIKRKFEKNTSRVHASSRKVCNENESRIIRKKRRMRKNVFDGRRAFIGYAQTTRTMNINPVSDQ